MECPACGREFVPRHAWPRGGGWCSAACRRRFVRELREVSFTVARCSAAIEMPAVVAARDELVRRYVRAAMPPLVTAGRPTRRPRFDPDVDVNELPLYWDE